MRAVLQNSFGGMSLGTSCQHGTSLNMRKELVPEQSGGVEERSHGGIIWYAGIEYGKSLKQSAPQ